jgi:hypothetical protein
VKAQSCTGHMLGIVILFRHVSLNKATPTVHSIGLLGSFECFSIICAVTNGSYHKRTWKGIYDEHPGVHDLFYTSHNPFDRLFLYFDRVKREENRQQTTFGFSENFESLHEIRTFSLCGVICEYEERTAPGDINYRTTLLISPEHILTLGKLQSCEQSEKIDGIKLLLSFSKTVRYLNDALELQSARKGRLPDGIFWASHGS